MNTEPNGTLSIAITGVLTIEWRELEQLNRPDFAPVNPRQVRQAPKRLKVMENPCA